MQARGVRAQRHLSVYVAVPVDVVEVEGPLQLFPDCAAQQYRQPCYKVLTAIRGKHQTLKDSLKKHTEAAVHAQTTAMFDQFGFKNDVFASFQLSYLLTSVGRTDWLFLIVIL